LCCAYDDPSVQAIYYWPLVFQERRIAAGRLSVTQAKVVWSWDPHDEWSQTEGIRR
jgi:hypothetical protein